MFDHDDLDWQERQRRHLEATLEALERDDTSDDNDRLDAWTALLRMQKGIYRTCRHCEQDIGTGYLEQRPTTQLCFSCHVVVTVRFQGH